MTGNSALLTDMYQLTMLQGYYEQGMEEQAVFEFFIRKLGGSRQKSQDDTGSRWSSGYDYLCQR